MNLDEVPAPEDLKVDLSSINNGNISNKTDLLDEKSLVESNNKYVYTKEEMLQLRSSMKAIPKPCCLDEDFFTREGIWDPEAWHKSSTSRSESPLVESKLASEGKKIQVDQIELAPRRKSFHQGCQVRSTTETCQVRPTTDRIEKSVPRTIFEKKSRLTGRASAQRKSLESKYREQNDEKHDKKNHWDIKHENTGLYKENRTDEKFKDSHRDRFEKSCEKAVIRDRTEITKKEKREEKEAKERPLKNEKDSQKSSLKGGKYRLSENEERYPEWMTDAPTNQIEVIELGGFKDIEEEKKAYAKKKGLQKSDVVTENEMKPSKPVEAVKKDSEKKSATPSDKMFDINEFFNEVNYYPPHLFHEDMVNGDGVKSRFTQWFQNQSRSSSRNSCSSNNNGSRPSSATFLPDEIFSGHSQSPVVPYFTPIQPAVNSSVVSGGTRVQSSNLLNIIQRHSESEHQKKEIRGRLNVLELEQNVRLEAENANNQSAFELFVQSMKASGQLPEKPAPVITGLPDHLLPKPPIGTSPTFEKLKRALSRSPSPVQIVQAVSTVANIIASNPAIDTELALLHSIDHLKQNQSLNLVGDKTSVDSFEFNNSVFDDFNTTNPALLKKNATQFMPTSVLKKLHSEKSLEGNDSMITHPDHSVINLSSNYPDVVSSVKNNPIESELDQLLSTPDRSSFKTLAKDSSVFYHSLPATPQQLPTLASHSISAPGTPGHRDNNDPPPVHRFPIANSKLADTYQSLLQTSPSAFDPINTNKNPRVGVIGSRPVKDSALESLAPYNDSSRGFADPRLAPGNNSARSLSSSVSNTNNISQLSSSTKPPFRHPVMQSTPSNAPQSQQQQLLHAQRMAQIQQAQLHQQQKLQQIVQQANQQKLKQTEQEKQFPVGIRPLLPDPEPFSQHRHPADSRYQQQQQEQIQLFRQKQQTNIQPQPPVSQLPGNNSFNNSSRTALYPTHQGVPHNLQMPLQQSVGLPANFGRSPQNLSGVNLAAQALMQQQLLERARMFAQAHLMQQQPQIMHAALIAQAALVRSQAQAAAMMQLNPRNIQAMAEQMGIRTNKPNSYINKNSQSFSATPSNASSDDFLTKWFSKDILQQVPPKTAELKGANVVSVEEVEKVQRVS
ncbi:uncharacterized protein LOC100200187 isoform X2 [Hydra vulgaris]|uniref:Uncharacterized protein LOC100200187 isoform X2 n=1 Tax=Hydra vulgaris TaxID=6087 RepID=A0ABM4CQI1_HYDVU